MGHIMAVVSMRHFPVWFGVKHPDRVGYHQTGKQKCKYAKKNSDFFSGKHGKQGVFAKESG